MKKLIAIACLALIGCAITSSNEIVTKNGKKGFAIECSGYIMWCGVAAMDGCPNGLIVLSRTDSNQKMVIECIDPAKP